MKVSLFKHFVLNDVMEQPHSTNQPHAHLMCMLCENLYSPPNPPGDCVPVPEPKGLDDWYNWEVDKDVLGVIQWVAGHLEKFHPELVS